MVPAPQLISLITAEGGLSLDLPRECGRAGDRALARLWPSMPCSIAHTSRALPEQPGSTAQYCASLLQACCGAASSTELSGRCVCMCVTDLSHRPMPFRPRTCPGTAQRVGLAVVPLSGLSARASLFLRKGGGARDPGGVLHANKEPLGALFWRPTEVPN